MSKIVRQKTTQLSVDEHKLSERKKIAAPLAARSAAHEEKAVDFDVEGTVVLDASKAYQLLDNPDEPTEALRSLLALR